MSESRPLVFGRVACLVVLPMIEHREVSEVAAHNLPSEVESVMSEANYQASTKAVTRRYAANIRYCTTLEQL